MKVNGVIPINSDEELPRVKDSKLFVCEKCYNHCSKSSNSRHLRDSHGVTECFSQYTITTRGYSIPNLKKGNSYLYRREVQEDDIVVDKLVKGRERDKSEGQFLRYIRVEDYYGKAYSRYLPDFNPETSSEVRETVGYAS